MSPDASPPAPLVFDVARIRETLSRLPADGSADSEEPTPATFYVPPEHMRALDWDAPLVVGARGSGKTYWWKALQTPALEAMLAPQPRPTVLAGFGVLPSANYPTRVEMVDLLTRFEARDIWWAVVLEALRRDPSVVAPLPVTGDQWSERVRWVARERAIFARVLADCDRFLEGNHAPRLLAFDALDRAAYDWADLTRLLRGLLEVILDLSTYRALRAKVFIRPDQYADEQAWAFRDGAKLRAKRVDLEWSSGHLYQMFFHRLANDARDGAAFREGAAQTGFYWHLHDGIFRGSDRPGPPAGARATLTAKRLEALQAATTASLAGPYMGTDKKRGVTYSWLPLHLADGHGRASPRSFLVAWRIAGERSADFTSERPVHHNALKLGVQRAAAIRVDEVNDDAPWVGTLCGALEGTMPTTEELVLAQWSQRPDLATVLASEREKPRRFELGPRGWLEDLLTRGVLTRPKAGRIDMPDVFRVGFNLRKRGGLTPVGHAG